MLDSILDTLKLIGEYLTLIFDFLIDLVVGLANFIISLASVPLIVSNALGNVLPPFIMAGVTSLIACVIILRIIGRD